MHAPKGFNDLLPIADRGFPFTATDGRAFFAVRVLGGRGRRFLPLRSRAFRNWFFDQCYSLSGLIPTLHLFRSLLVHLEAQAARDPVHTGVPLDLRTNISHDHDLLLDLANPQGEFVRISPTGWKIDAGPDHAFETGPSTSATPAPEL